MPPSAGEDGPVLTFTLGRRRRNTAQALSEPGRTAELARIWAGASKPRQGPGLTQPDSIWTKLAGGPDVGLRWHEPHQQTPLHLWGYFLIPPLLLQRSPARSASLCPAELLMQSYNRWENRSHRSSLGFQGLQTLSEMQAGCWQRASFGKGKLSARGHRCAGTGEHQPPQPAAKVILQRAELKYVHPRHLLGTGASGVAGEETGVTKHQQQSWHQLPASQKGFKQKQQFFPAPKVCLGKDK